MPFKNHTSYLAHRTWLFLVPCFLCLIVLFISSCGIYKFKDINFDPTLKTVKVNFIVNNARYVNPQLSPKLTDKLRQKIVSQTRLTQTNSDNADWEISGEIKEYSVTTSGISQQQVSINRLNVTVQITVLDHRTNTQQDPILITKNFDFSANLTLQAAEAQLTDEIIRNLTDEIFNRIFSNW